MTTHIINSIIITTIIMIITLTVMMMPRCEVHQGVEAEVQCKAHQGGTGDPAARFPQNDNYHDHEDHVDDDLQLGTGE